MKAFVIFSIALTILSVNCEKVEEKESKGGTTYTTKYDNLDLDEILKSDRLLLNYVNCLLEKAHCSPDADELKKNLPDAINNDCKKCSEKQRVGSREVIHFLIDNKPEWWSDLEKRYDPKGSYKKAYLAEKSNLEDADDNDDCIESEEKEKDD